jgi:hypothetical protein
MTRTVLLQEIRKMRFDEAYEGWDSGTLTQGQAAELPGMCERSFRRYLTRYKASGLDGLIDHRLEQVSNRRAPVDEVLALTTQCRARHVGWNVKHFHNWYQRSGPPSEIAYFRIRQERLLQKSDKLSCDLAGDGGQALMFDSVYSSDLNDMLETLMSIRHSAESSQLEALNHEYLEKVVLERTLRILSISTATSSQMPLASAYRITQAAQALIESSPEEPLTVMTLCRGWESAVPRFSAASCRFMVSRRLHT